MKKFEKLIIYFFKDLEKKGWEEDEKHEMHRVAQFYVWKQGLLYKKRRAKGGPDIDLLIVPEDFRQEIIRRHHDHLWAGHMDRTRTYAAIAKRYW